MTACDYCEIDYVEEWDLFHYASGKKICKIHSEGYKQGLLKIGVKRNGK